MRSQPRERRSPDQTLASVTDDLIEDMHIPQVPSGIPQRLEDALNARVEALLFALKESVSHRFMDALEVRLARDAQRAVLTAVELHLRDAEVHYARFRHLMDELGFVRAEVGFRRSPDDADGDAP